ncbi:unnamed protein product [Rotaria sordida]|uniref:Uncharacterized protein n=1 Tax=Rotaria sordida TaxID=392033 RepID=A0A815G250_9BILA|nr:unnamed protein product [Rotaria sordida]CAF3823628.1 unnamed protein product [Rotaria sordida]
MVYHWTWDFLAECAADYQINKAPGINELRAIGKELNNESFDFFLDLETWFCSHRMGEQAVAQRHYEAKKVAA